MIKELHLWHNELIISLISIIGLLRKINSVTSLSGDVATTQHK